MSSREQQLQQALEAAATALARISAYVRNPQGRADVARYASESAQAARLVLNQVKEVNS